MEEAQIDFPLENPAFNTNGSTNCNNALFKFDFGIIPKALFGVSTSDTCINVAANDTVAITLTDSSENADKIVWNLNGTIVEGRFKDDDTTIFITQPGRYEFRQDIENISCAIGRFDTIIVNVRPDNIVLEPLEDTVICAEDSVLLAITNKNANTFTWAKNRNFNNPLAGNDSTIKVKLEPGINVFYVRAGNNITNACEKIDSISVNFLGTVVSATVSVDTTCESSPVLVSSIQQNVDRFVWDFGNGEIDSTSVERFVTYPVPGDYEVELAIENIFCKIKDTVKLNVHVTQNQLDFLDLEDTLKCGGDEFRVIKPSNGRAIKFIWSSNRNFTDTLNSSLQDSSFLMTQTDSSTFYLKISDRFCEKVDSLNAEFIELGPWFRTFARYCVYSFFNRNSDYYSRHGFFSHFAAKWFFN